MPTATDSIQVSLGTQDGSKVATDKIEQPDGTFVHAEIVKVATGGDGVDGGLAARKNPFPVASESIEALLTAILTESKEQTRILRLLEGTIV